MPSGTLVILSGPSGVGKDTIIDAWQKLNPQVVRVVACTTRAPRENEINGHDYHFLTKEDFELKINNDHFLEYKKVHENYYGTPSDQVDQLLNLGKIAILKIDVQGALEVMAKKPEILSIFLLPPSTQELERRLTSRKTDSPEQVQIRLTTALQEIEQSAKYKYQVVNENIMSAVEQLEQIVSNHS